MFMYSCIRNFQSPRLTFIAKQAVHIYKMPNRMNTSSAITDKRWPSLPIIRETDTGFDVVSSGYSYGDIDRHGRVVAYRIPTYCERSRAVMYYPHLMGGGTSDGKWWQRMFKDYLPFVVGAKYEVHPGFYDRRQVNNMLLTTDRIVNLTKSTYQHYQEHRSLETKALLHSSIVVVVLVDNATRRAIPLPEEITAHFKGKDTAFKGELASRVKPLGPPPSQSGSLFTVSCRANWSDVDANNHVNQSVFHRLCDDAIADASHEGFFSSLKWDVAENFRVTSMEASFLAEVAPGEPLVVKVWEDSENPLKVNAVIQKKEKPAFQYSCLFTPSPKAKY